MENEADRRRQLARERNKGGEQPVSLRKNWTQEDFKNGRLKNTLLNQSQEMRQDARRQARRCQNEKENLVEQRRDMQRQRAAQKHQNETEQQTAERTVDLRKRASQRRQDETEEEAAENRNRLRENIANAPSVQATTVQAQNAANERCIPEVKHRLDEIIRENNVYTASYSTLQEVELHEEQHAQQEQRPMSVVNLVFNKDGTADRRKYNLPTVNEMAMVFSNTEGDPSFIREFKVYPRNNEVPVINLNILSPNLDPMTLKVEQYRGLTGLTDHLQNVSNAANAQVGRTVTLPSSFQDSPRNKQERYQDAMAIVHIYGPPDRPDLVARVFNIKLHELLNDITKKYLFGRVIAYLYTIGFQNRGLPHAHLLIILHPDD
uniref:Helitron helicase-like domain-containing protein n=1 Tax=Octopus bimaculoides TaxID=37653 RepID=A0A0L8HQA2_OCTBM